MVSFFSHIGDTRCYCSSMSSPSDTTRSLSIEGHSCSDNTRSLYLSSEGHSLDLFAQMSPLACPLHRRQLRALLGSRLISLLRKPAVQQAGRPRARRQKGPERTSTASSSALSPRPRRRLRSSSSVALDS
jgi:hypothetical protein